MNDNDSNDIATEVSEHVPGLLGPGCGCWTWLGSRRR